MSDTEGWVIQFADGSRSKPFASAEAAFALTARFQHRDATLVPPPILAAVLAEVARQDAQGAGQNFTRVVNNAHYASLPPASLSADDVTAVAAAAIREALRLSEGA